MAQPLVSAGMMAKELALTPRVALRIVEELGLCEMTGRGGFGPGVTRLQARHPIPNFVNSHPSSNRRRSAILIVEKFEKVSQIA